MFDLRRGDCLKILPTLAPGSVDALVTDPPYALHNRFGTQFKLNGKRRLDFDWDGPETKRMVEDALTRAVTVLKPSAAIFVFCSIEQVTDLLRPFREAGFILKPAAWVKKCPPPALLGNWWPSAFELAFYGYRKSPWFGDTDRNRRNVFVSDSYRHGQPGKVAHPTQKPLRLITRLVSAIVPPSGLCLDPFMGSGTTGVACANTDRHFIGIEKDPAYFKIARKRIKEACAQSEALAA